MKLVAEVLGGSLLGSWTRRIWWPTQHFTNLAKILRKRHHPSQWSGEEYTGGVTIRMPHPIGVGEYSKAETIIT